MNNKAVWEAIIKELTKMSDDEFAELVKKYDKDIWGLDSLDLRDCEEFYGRDINGNKQ